jgi:nicotinamidase-related amidase
MRLPADAALVVIDPGPETAAANPAAAENVAALVAAWRAEGLPIVDVRAGAAEADAPSEGEILIRRAAASAFVGTDLEARLDELGATTVVICGAPTPGAVEATARHAGDLGYQIFVVADACWAAGKVDLRGHAWPAEDVHALSLAHLRDYGKIVDAATARAAAALAKARQRRARGKG